MRLEILLDNFLGSIQGDELLYSASIFSGLLQFDFKRANKPKATL